MSKALSPQPEFPELAPPSVPPGDVPAVLEGGEAQSSRVRELPPPPKAADELRLPQLEADESSPGGWRRLRPRRTFSSCAASFLFHFLLLVVLALVVESSLVEGPSGELLAGFSVAVPLDSSLAELSPAVVLEPNRIEGNVPELDPHLDAPTLSDPSREPTRPSDARRASYGFEPAEPIDWLMRNDAPVGGGLEGRRGDARAAMVESGGGNRQSELAVERGLRWLMAHQLDDGRWSFDLTKSVCRGQCRNPGSESSTTAATALVLLPFLGAGYTHRDGEYREVVRRGLYYLGTRALTTPHGSDLQEGTMYAQGLAAIALCEAYAMTDDETLRPFAQSALDFVVYAQDPKGGGWRYTPGEPGDTTVTGWQLMGLKSGQMARLSVPSPTVYLVQHFLSSVQYEDGSQYGYMDPSPRKATTAVGLLCRMYTGWGRHHPALQRGVVYLGNWGPSEENIYYNYYATQVMRHYGGPMWERWNEKMRDHLIATQATAGHEAGSWHFAGDRGAKQGGRLYCTALAVMTLEVYYRYMPLYGQESVEDEF